MKVMAVDDERDALEALEKELKKLSEVTEVQCFESPTGALDYARLHPLDVAFLDIEMYGVTGLGLAKQLKEFQPKANVVFVTGYAHYAVDAFSLSASDYLLKPATANDIRRALGHLRNPVVKGAIKKLFVQTFGNFEVFSEGEIVHFPRRKSKELFAYLILKRGTGVTIKELTSVLFEDRTDEGSLQRQMQTIISDMIKALAKVSAKDVIVKKYNSLAVDPSKVDCDYYRFLQWDPGAVNAYTGEFMANYSWAEFTVGYLDNRA